MQRSQQTQRESNSNIFRMAFAIGGFVSLFLLLFQPFGLKVNLFDASFFIVLGIGVMNSVVTLLNHLVIERFVEKVFLNHWDDRINKNLWRLWSLFLLLMSNFIYLSALTGFENVSLISFLRFSGQVLLIAIIPVSFLLLYQRARQNEQYRRSSRTLSETLEQQPESTTTFTLKNENNKTVLSLSLNEFLYLESADNYVAVHHLQQDELQRDLLRHSLKGIEAQLEGIPVVRCHRSYIVNLTQALKLSGNAQGMQLQLKQGVKVIPVSRNYIESVKAAIEALA